MSELPPEPPPTSFVRHEPPKPSGWQRFLQMLGAAGVVLLIFGHECGHLIVARQFGLNVGAPMFIPFMGAFIALKDTPRNAWMEAWVGIGGPLFGTGGAVRSEERRVGK